jgi:AraC-like DNA-binding protein
MKISAHSDAVQRTIGLAPTLRVALDKFIRNLARKNSTAFYSVTISNHHVRFCRRQHRSACSIEAIYTDLDFFIELQIIISKYVGVNWCPQYISSKSTQHMEELRWVFFPHTRFISGQKNSWLELPRRYLKLPKRVSEDTMRMHSARHNPSTKDAASFIYALKRTLTENLSEGYPAIDSAANLMHTSVRTLQRHLALAGLTYSKLIEYVRFEAASEMLGNPNLKIIDIAYTLGYEDPSHFSRAFRRIAGLSPREFRLAHLKTFEIA